MISSNYLIIKESVDIVSFIEDMFTEPTAQQERIPQVLPLGIGIERDGLALLFDVELLKRENFFFTSFELHCGQVLSFSEVPIFCINEKVVLHLLHEYS
jgi:hypothetical protein